MEEIKDGTKCQIIIRGKGSLRSGMTGIKKDGTKVDALDEPLHAWIQGQAAEDVKKAAKKIQDLIDMEIYNPDCEQVNKNKQHLLGYLPNADFEPYNTRV